MHTHTQTHTRKHAQETTTHKGHAKRAPRTVRRSSTRTRLLQENTPKQPHPRTQRDTRRHTQTHSRRGRAHTHGAQHARAQTRPHRHTQKHGFTGTHARTRVARAHARAASRSIGAIHAGESASRVVIDSTSSMPAGIGDGAWKLSSSSRVYAPAAAGAEAWISQWHEWHDDMMTDRKRPRIQPRAHTPRRTRRLRAGGARA